MLCYSLTTYIDESFYYRFIMLHAVFHVFVRIRYSHDGCVLYYLSTQFDNVDHFLQQ
jgi:hypothetical protein